tara:strand:- start:99 stop:638 length:540 start_codon:yes stop_codon:yes gene_type:complete
MNWKDILKETITQGRVKEIEDIDIDIDEDDCLRWLNKLYNIILRHPEGILDSNQITDEEEACIVKALWEDTINFEFEDKNTQSSMEYYRKNKRVRTSNPYMERKTFNNDVDGSVALELFSVPSDYGDTLGILLISTIYQTLNSKSVRFLTKDREKISKVLKEICTYLNISYDKMTEGLL